MAIDADERATLAEELHVSPGWKMVEDQIRDKVRDCETQLLGSCPPEFVEIYRAQRAALTWVLGLPDELRDRAQEEAEQGPDSSGIGTPTSNTTVTAIRI
jgi:hypothetical protein